MLDYYLTNLFLVHGLELLAAAAGLYFLQNSSLETGDKLFVRFLCYIFLVESFNLYSTYAYFNNFETLSFLKDSPFRRNYWIGNINKIVSYIVYCHFFLLQFSSAKFKKVFKILIGIFVISSTINLVVTDVYFYAYSSYSTIFGTLLLMLIIIAYYYELLISDKILNSFKSLSFYVSFIALIWYLTTTPLFIYSNYFNEDKSVEFVAIYRTVLVSANVFMYGGYIITFLILSRKRKLEKSFST